MTRRDRQARQQRRRRRFDPMQRANDFTVEPAPRTEQLSIERRVNLLSSLAKNAILLAGKPPGRQLLETVLELPEPSALDVGRQIILRSGPGIADRIYIGMQIADDSFVWVESQTELSSGARNWVRSFAVTTPYGAACDPAGNVWVACYTNHRVRRYSSSGTLLHTIGDGTTSGAAAFGSGRVNAPCGVAWVSAGLRYPHEGILIGQQGASVAGFYSRWTYEPNVAPPLLYPVTSTYGATDLRAGTLNTPGSSTSRLDQPLGVAVDGGGYYYVADQDNDRVMKWRPDFTASNSAQSTSSVLTIGGGVLSRPQDVKVDSGGNIYVADLDNDCVRVFNAAGTLTNTIGSSGSGNGQLNAPCGVALDPQGYLHITDFNNSRVAIFQIDGTWVANYGSAGSGDGQFNGPLGIAINSSGVIFVCDYNNNRVSVWV